jgi:pyroglutamyl-peptidase
MRLLLSGFEPFGEESLNPSWEVARAIVESPPPGVEVTPLRLPVRARISFAELVPAFQSGNYDAWLGLGQAEGRADISVERIGINLLVDRDPEGHALPEVPIVEEGPAAYFAQLPVSKLAAAITAVDVPARVSNTAGTYICNEALFVMQHHLWERRSALPSGLIHLPYLPEQATGKREAVPSMALESQVRGVRAAIAFLQGLVSGG